MDVIKIPTKEKSTTIRISEKTKRMLEALAKGRETHEEIIARLIKLFNNLSAENGSKIIDKGNVIGTEYERLSKTIDIEVNNKKFSVVCTFNDLSLIVILRNNQLKNYIRENMPLEWKLGLEIVNVKTGAKWQSTSHLNAKERILLYFICVKQILEETFDIKLYQIMTQEDFLNDMKWTETYTANNLSRDSLGSDIRNKLK